MILFIAFLSPFFEALSDMIESLLSNRTFKHQATMIFYVSMMNFVFVPLVLFLGMPTIPAKESLWFYLILAVIDVAYLYPFYSAMKVIDTSIVSALFSLGQVIVPILSYLVLNDVLTLHQYIGFAIIIMASVALSMKSTKIPKLNRAFYYMVFASFLLSLRVIVVKCTMNLEGNWINLVMYPNMISGILPLGLLFITKYRKDIVKNFPPYLKRFRLFALDEFICFLGLVCSTYALDNLSPVVSSAINSMRPIFLLLTGAFLLYFYKIPLKEKITPRMLVKKIFFFILMILGVILVV
ncbi:MAG TPA: hypothetical protein DIC64_04830 [Alphaproteobacteria bacterium]|nr:hypothetical protein [Alphaproteobacteria bacterium]